MGPKTDFRSDENEFPTTTPLEPNQIFWVSSKRAKNYYFGISSKEKLIFRKIIEFVCFRAQFTSKT
jgi:hypothetical protein